MEFTYRNKKNIAGTTLFSIMLIFLLAFNFRIFSETPGLNNFENFIIIQTNTLGHAILPSNNNLEITKDAVQTNCLLKAGLVGNVTDHILLLFISLVWIFRSKSFCGRRYTLISLHVRMDN